MSRSSKSYIKRHVKIINYLKVQPLSYDQIVYKLQNSIDDFVGYSLRTFQRDVKAIESLYDLKIKFNRSIQKYEIISDATELSQGRMFESIEMVDVLSRGSKSKILLDNRKLQTGAERFEEVIEAIEKNLKMKMNYKKYGEEKEKFRFIHPIAIKESRFRWYLIAKDEKDSKIKSFAFDRITALSITDLPFTKITEDVEGLFQDFFGINRQKIAPKTKVVLETSDISQVYYLESLKLHPSQNIVTIDSSTYQILLELYITYDFVLELMYLAGSVRVVQPLFLVDLMKKELNKALKLYEEKGE